MLNKALHREFENGLPGPLYYLWSEESCFLEDAHSRFVEIVLASGPVDFNYDVFYPSSDPQQMLDAASTLPVMAQRRLVVLKDFHQMTAPAVKALMQYLGNPSDSTCLLVLSQKVPKASLDVDWKIYDLNIKERDVPAWLKNVSARKGVKLTDDAVDCLIDFAGYDIGMLMMEIEKLALSGLKHVSGKDIMSSASVTRKFSSFELIDSLIAGQKTKAFRILKALLAANAMEAPVVLGTLNWHYRQFHTLWLNKGRRPLKMREKTYRALVKYLPSFREDDFFLIFRNLHEADFAIKTSGRPDLVLEVLLIKLLQKGSRN